MRARAHAIGARAAATASLCAAGAFAGPLVPTAVAQPAAFGMVPSLTGTGARQYYWQVTLALENRGGDALAEVNGHLVSEVEGERVGRSRGASFLDLAPGGRAEAVFETPDAPSDAVTT